MRLAKTSQFMTDYVRLSLPLQTAANKQLLRLEQDSRHPSLRVKKIRSVQGVFEAGVTRSHRFTFHFEKDAIVLRRIGPHDKTLKHP